MKKTLIVLLILAVAGGVFAQEVTWSGEVLTGAMVKMGDGIIAPNGDETATIQADEDDVPTGVKARLNAAVTDDNWGLELGAAADIFTSGADLSKGVYFYNAHGWMSFVDMIKIRAGLIDPGVWTTKGPEDFNFSSGLGIRVEVTPIEGLNVGLLLNYGRDKGNSAWAGPMKVGDFLQETVFGASYSNPDMMNLYVSVAFALDSKHIDDEAKSQAVIFGFGINPIEALSIKVEAKVEELGQYSDFGWMWFIEDVSFRVMDPLLVGIRFDEKLASEDSSLANLLAGNIDFYKTALGFKPYVEFTVEAVEGLSVGAEIPVWMKDNGDGLTLASFGATAWAKYAMGGSWVKASYGFESTTKDFGDALVHTIRLIFGYSF